MCEQDGVVYVHVLCQCKLQAMIRISVPAYLPPVPPPYKVRITYLRLEFLCSQVHGESCARVVFSSFFLLRHLRRV
jgi:hypothetical protein